MKLLLDTHVLIWSQEGVERLGAKTKRDLIHADTLLYVSPISTLEIARLVDGGRISLDIPASRWVDDTVKSLRCATIEVSHRIAAAAYDLPEVFHKDPADRLLVASARTHELILLTADERILDYRHVATRDART